MYTIQNAAVFELDRVDEDGPYRERYGRSEYDSEPHPCQANKRGWVGECPRQ